MTLLSSLCQVSVVKVGWASGGYGGYRSTKLFGTLLILLLAVFSKGVNSEKYTVEYMILGCQYS